MKKKIQTILFALLLVTLFYSTSCVESTINSMYDYPTTVREGDTFRITINFDYETAVDCLYGPTFTFSYRITYGSQSPYPSFTSMNVPIPIVDSIRRPSSIDIDIDSSILSLGEIDEDVTFTFTSLYSIGYIYYVGDAIQVARTGFRDSGMFELTITNGLPIQSNVTTLYIYAGSAFAAVVLAFVIYIFIKRRK